ncbi:MAG: hypothetical protein Q8O09_00435 [Bacillota bacterium]|nr:hypothetical protein [Bacillota bacterium]
MPEEAVIRINRFSGIDQSGDETGMPIGASPDAQNMDCEGGTLQTAKGFAKYNTPQAPAAIRTLMKYFRRNLDGTVDSFLLCTTDTAVYALSTGGYWVAIATDLNGGYFDYINYQKNWMDILIFGNGEDNPMKWTGYEGATNLGGSPPCFSQVCLHYERAWGSAIKSEPDRVYYSKAYDSEDWSTPGETGFIDIPTWNGGSIIALKTLFDNVVVFKDYDIYRVFGTYPGSYEVSRVHGITGPIAPRSIVQLGDVVYFLSAEGLCFFDGVRARPVEDEKLKKFFQDLNRDYAKYACAVTAGGKLYLALPEGGAATCNNCVVEYDPRKGSYMIRRGFRVDTFLEYQGKLLFANDTRYIYEYGQGNTYDGEPIESYWKTPYMDLGVKDIVKGLTALYATAKGAGAGGGEGALLLGATSERGTKEKTFTLPTDEKSVRFSMKSRGRRMQLTFSNVNGSVFSLNTPEFHFELDQD